MIKYFVLFSLCIIIFSCEKKHSIEGHIKGLGNDTLLVKSLIIKDKYAADELYAFDFDTIYAKNDRFSYDHKSNKPTRMEINVKSPLKRKDGRDYYPGSLQIFLQLLPDDKIKIEGVFDTYSLDYTVKGSPISSEYNTKIRKKKLKYMVADVENFHKRDSLKFFKGNVDEINRLSQIAKENWELYKNIEENYINENLDSELSAYLLWYHGKLYDMKDKLSPKVRNGIYKPFFDHAVAMVKRTKLREITKEKIKIGSIAPNFSLKTLENTTYDLSMMQTDYIVLDFWGSWCLPCIEGFPKMKTYHEKYKRRISFIGIACRDSEAKWREAVKKYNLEWLQLLNSSELENDVSLKYEVGGYPTKVIIDKNKTIVGIFESESDDFYIKLVELMK